MTTDMNALDEILSFPATGGTGSSNEYVGDGYWWLALTEISMPFQEPDFNDPNTLVTKVRFYFEVAGTYDRKTGEVVESEFDGQKVSLKVKADANGPKSTKYLVASALLGQDLAAYIAANGAVKPSLLVGLSCWGKVENKPSKKDPAMSYTELAWNGFSAVLPQHLIRPITGQAPNRQAPNQMVGRPAAPTRPAVAQQPKADSPF